MHRLGLCEVTHSFERPKPRFMRRSVVEEVTVTTLAWTIDGVPLTQVWQPEGVYFGTSGLYLDDPAVAAAMLRVQAGSPVELPWAQFDDGRVPLYPCHCWDPWCVGLSTRVLTEGDVVRWDEVGEQQADVPFVGRPERRTETFVFERAQYEAVILEARERLGIGDAPA